MNASTNSSNKPVDRVRLGTIQAAIWRNTTDEGYARYGVTLERLYRDTNGDWQSTGSLGRDDLLPAGEVMKLAYHRVHELQTEDRQIDGDAAKAAREAQGAAR